MKVTRNWKHFQRRLRYWLDHSNRQRLLQEEMEFHIESIAKDLTDQGMPEEEAHFLARKRFGNRTQTEEDARFTWIARWISDLAQDLRYSFRGMGRNAGFTTFTILIAGLGIGASSVVFSVVNALLLRPLPFRDPGRLVWMSNGNDATSTQTEHYSDLRAWNRSFSDMAAFADWGVGNRQLTGSGEPDRLNQCSRHSEFLPIAGSAACLGKMVHRRGVPRKV